MPAERQREFFPELQVYSGIAILFVVFIHVNYYFSELVLGTESVFKSGHLMRFFDNFVHIAVQMFIFIAGFKYAIHNYIESFQDYKKFVLGILKKILKPFLVLSGGYIIVYSVISAAKTMISGAEFHFISFCYGIFIDFIKIFLGYNHIYQLWYVPMYLYLVLSYPLIEKIIGNQILRFAIFLFIASVSLYYKMPFNHNYLYYYYLFELGVYFSQNRAKFGLRFKYLFAGLYLCVLFASVFVEGGFFYQITKILLPLFGVLVFYYVALFLKSSNLFLILGNYSFVIFLFHEPIFLKIPAKIFSALPFFENYILFSLCGVTSILLSIAFYKLLEVLKFKKYIF